MRNRVSMIHDIDDGLIEISMAVAIPFATRQQIAQMREQGKLYRQISQELVLPLWLVGYGIKPIWNRAARPINGYVLMKLHRIADTTNAYG